MDNDAFLIGELAARAGVSRDTIGYYEAIGVMPAARRTGGGYRVYGAADVGRIGFVGQAQALGLTLDEIADVLAMVDGGRKPCVHVRDKLADRLAETQARIDELRALERRLRWALENAVRADDAGESGCHCRIIELRGCGPSAEGG